MYVRTKYLHQFSSALLVCWLLLPLPTSAQIYINEISPSNSDVITDEFGGSPDWIELYNAGETAVDLTNYYLSDDLTEPTKWQFPTFTLAAGAWVVIFASDRNVQSTQLLTNFKLAAEGEAVVLADPNGQVVDWRVFPALETDQSIGRLQDGGPNWAIFPNPTPRYTNAGATGAGFTSAPRWETAGQFFAQPTEITLHHPNPAASIYFTRDGRMPNEADELYIGPIRLDTTTALRAIAIAPGLQASSVESRTFFIGTTHELPVVSLIGDPEALWSWEHGILVDGGPNATLEWPYYGSNYWANTQVPIHAEFFTQNQELGIAFRADTRIHGGRGARTKPMKPLRILVDKKYGSSTIEYPFFSDRKRTTYQRLVLRNASGDYNNAHFRDAFLARYFIKSGLNLDVLAHQPYAIYMNGAYYGLTNLREKSDEYYLQHTYGIPVEKLDVLEEDSTVIVGDFAAFDSMYQFVMEHDLSKAQHFQTAASYFDIENIAEGFVVQSALNNSDWLKNNIKYWRERKPGARWRYILFDLDIAMGRHGWSKASYDNMAGLLNPLVGRNKHVDLFMALLDYKPYQHYFINRYADLLNTIFRSEIFAAEVDRTVVEIDAEMHRHFDRWGWPGYDIWRNDRIADLYEYLEARPDYARAHLRTYFGLENEVQLQLKVHPEGAGQISINTIQPKQSPWAGVYFNGVPVALRVEAEPGYVFQHWRSEKTIQEADRSSEIRYNFTEDDVVTAYFTPEQLTQELHAYLSDPRTLVVNVQLLTAQSVAPRLYDLQGRLVRTYSKKFGSAGFQQLQLSLPTLSKGVYLLRLLVDGELRTAKIMLD